MQVAILNRAHLNRDRVEELLLRADARSASTFTPIEDESDHADHMNRGPRAQCIRDGRLLYSEDTRKRMRKLDIAILPSFPASG
jgi:hypothetical protein